MGKTVIIGGVAGGASCAARLRRLDGEREIIILESADCPARARRIHFIRQLRFALSCRRCHSKPQFTAFDDSRIDARQIQY